VSELVVIFFGDRYRAPEVLNELRRRGWPWSQDMERAIAVTIDPEGATSVHLSVALSKGKGRHWARIWGALLNSALFIPSVDQMIEAAENVALPPLNASTPSSDDSVSFEMQWWRDVLAGNDTFTRDVAALLRANSSAILLLLRTPEISKPLTQLRDYGHMIVHTAVNEEQDQKLSLMLSSR